MQGNDENCLITSDKFKYFWEKVCFLKVKGYNIKYNRNYRCKMI